MRRVKGKIEQRLTTSMMNLRSSGNIVDEDPTFQLQLVDSLTRRSLENRVALLVLLPDRSNLLATTDDSLEQVNLVFPLVVVLDDDEVLLEKQVAERVDIVTFPILDSST